MGWLSFQKPFWGIDIGASSVKAVRLLKTRRGMKLLDIGMKEIPMEEEFRQENIAAALDELIREKRRPKAVVNFSGRTPVIRYLTLPVMPKGELAEAVKWEAKKLVSFPVDQMIFDFMVAGGKQDQDIKRYEMVLVVAEKEIVREQWTMMRKAGLEIVAIDVNPLSLLNSLRHNSPNDMKESLIYIDIGATKTDISILKQGILKFTRRLEMGGDQITRRIEQDMKLPYDEAEKLKREKGMGGEEAVQELVKSECDRFIVEIQRSVDYYRAQFREGIFKKIILMGGGSLLSGFPEYFSTYFDSKVEINDPFAEIIGAEAAQEFQMIKPRFSTGVGLALRTGSSLL